MPDKPQKPYDGIYRKVPKWQDLRFYQKADTLYQLTYVFCQQFLPRYGDRTVDQMVQAARSGKQNIVEGMEDGKTSTEMEVKLLNVARSSIGELRQDFEDHLKARHLKHWSDGDERFLPMQDFTRQHNLLGEYEPYLQLWSEEEMANIGLTLCFQIDAMMNKYMEMLEKEFVTEGGIKERMYRARTGYRQQLDQQLEQAKAEAAHWKAQYDDLRKRALKAYNEQKQEIATLKERLRQLEHNHPQSQ